MKALIKILLLLLFICVCLPTYSQENAVVLKRTPEQEASKQTEKLQEELNLNNEQKKQIYEINLHYARERQVSNKRSEAMERMKNKNADIKQVLNEEQNNRLQTKRYERSSFQNQSVERNSINSTGNRSSTVRRANPSVRILSTDINGRTNYRTYNSQNQNSRRDSQTIRRGSTSPSRNSHINNNTPTYRPQSVRPSVQRKTETRSNSTRK